MKKRIAFICALFCVLLYVTLCQNDDDQKKSDTQLKLEKFRNEVALLKKQKKDLEKACNRLGHKQYWLNQRNGPQSNDRYDASLFPSGS